jgi:hypothetical protein
VSGQTDSTPGRENTSFDPFAFYLGAGRYSENSYKRALVAQARDRDRDSRMPLVLSWKSIDGFDMNHFEHVAKPQRPAGVFRRRRAGRRHFRRPAGHVRRGAGPERRSARVLISWNRLALLERCEDGCRGEGGHRYEALRRVN